MASIEAIEGIGVRYRKKLLAGGIKTTGALLKAGASRKGRKDLAASTGCTEKQILEWVNRSDLMRVRGVGSEYSDLLEASGVDTVKALAKRNSSNLHAKMNAVNSAKRKPLVRRPPSLAEVERWVAHAGELDPVVTH